MADVADRPGNTTRLFYIVIRATFFARRKQFMNRKRSTKNGGFRDWEVFFLAVVLGAVSQTSARLARRTNGKCGDWIMVHDAKHVHESNDFNFGPIKEVAILFAGIFATMMPALDWLQSMQPVLGSQPRIFLEQRRCPAC